ncbi:MAG: hypothetical protein ACO1OQ_00400 [Rufibacter sp.]
MKLSSSIILAVLFFCFMSCSEKKSQNEGFVPQPLVLPGTTTTATGDSGAVQPATGSVAVNPPHGQPGHRCDLQVGAPLPGGGQPAATPAPTTTQTVVPTVSPTVTATPAPAAAVAPGMNPPHGQPGHRCDIQVGAPLK